MASKKNTKGEGSNVNVPVMPEGFTKVNNEQSNAWFKFAEGAVISGELVGRFQRKRAQGKDNKVSFFYQVKIDQPCTVSRKIEGDTEIEEAEEGTIVNVDEKSALESLQTYTNKTGERFNVWICAQEKIDLDGGQTFWRCAVGVRPL